ncbi:MAG: DEAD/DEAH box helicase [Holdemanella porci]
MVDLLKEYFTFGEASLRQGVIFCVNVSHANEMARLLNKEEELFAASYTGQTKILHLSWMISRIRKSDSLCTCNMISEGWDYPELGILVMARPTLSKVLYLQQIE